MTDKQIIIDGVDVSECPHIEYEYKWWNMAGHEQNSENVCALSFDKNADFEEDFLCQDNPNCCYKQLSRKTQECEELKAKCKKYGEINEQETKDYAELKAKNEKLKKQYLILIQQLNIDAKQLDQLKAENEEWKKVNDKKNELLAKLGCPTTATAKMKAHCLQEQLDKLKSENEKYKKEIMVLRKNYNEEDCTETCPNVQVYERELKQAEQKLERIRDIVEPYKMTIKKICKNCEKYDSCHACRYKDISCYKYTSPNAKSCDEFTYLDKLIPNIISNQILQIIDEVEDEE